MNFSVVSAFSLMVSLLGASPSATAEAESRLRWQPVETPSTDAVWALALAGPGNLYMGTAQRGLFASDDGGKSWTSLDEGLSDRNVGSVLATPDDLLVGTRKGVQRREAGHESWETAALAGKVVYTLTPGPDGRIFAGTDDGAFDSADGGRTWTPAGPSGTEIRAFAFDDAGGMLAGGAGGVYRRAAVTDWIKTDEGLAAGQVWGLARVAGTIYAATSQGVYRSSDMGEAWTPAGLAGLTIWALAADSEGRLFAGSFGAGVYRSDDGGGNWTELNVGLDHPDVRTLAVDSEGTLYAGTLGGGLYRLAPGAARWSAISRPQLSVTFVDPDLETGMVLGSLAAGIFYSTDGGSIWHESRGLTNVDAWGHLALAPGHILAGSSEGVVLSTDGGRSWEPSSRGLYSYTVFAFAGGSGGHPVFAASEAGIFRSDDRGRTWSPTGLTDRPTWFVAMKPEGDLFAGTGATGVYHSADDGEHWQPTSLSIGGVFTIGVSPAGDLFACTDLGLFRTSDNGRRWQRLEVFESDDPTAAVWSVGFDSDGAVLAGTGSAGIFRSADGGKTWHAVNDGFFMSSVWNFTFSSDGDIFVGSGSRGLFRSVRPPGPLSPN